MTAQASRLEMAVRAAATVDGGITAPTYALRTASAPAATDPASPWRRRA